MSKYWSLIVANRPHIFSLGDHENFDGAVSFAQEFVDRKNAEIQKMVEEKNISDDDRPPDYDLLWVLDRDDLRSLIGDIHLPYVISKPKREEIGIEAPIRRGGPAAESTVKNLPVVEHVCEDGGAPCEACLSEENPATEDNQ